MHHLRIREFLAPGHACHVAVSRLSPGKPPLHTHDFDELFWVQHGHGRHLIGGEDFELHPGRLITIRARDRHALHPTGDRPLDIVNIAFPAARRRELAARYNLRPSDPWEADLAARHHSLTGIACSLLGQYAAELVEGSRSLLALDRFLLNLHQLLGAMRLAAPPAELPDWLAYACREMQRPDHLRHGTRAMVDLAGRSPEHVSRTMRRLTGRSPTAFVNDLRLSAAAARLARGHEPIAEIAMDLGLSNLAHFYCLFRQRFGLTPRRYRLREQMITGHDS